MHNLCLHHQPAATNSYRTTPTQDTGSHQIAELMALVKERIRREKELDLTMQLDSMKTSLARSHIALQQLLFQASYSGNSSFAGAMAGALKDTSQAYLDAQSFQ